MLTSDILSAVALTVGGGGGDIVGDGQIVYNVILLNAEGLVGV